VYTVGERILVRNKAERELATKYAPRNVRKFLRTSSTWAVAMLEIKKALQDLHKCNLKCF